MLHVQPSHSRKDLSRGSSCIFWAFPSLLPPRETSVTSPFRPSTSATKGRRASLNIIYSLAWLVSSSDTNPEHLYGASAETRQPTFHSEEPYSASCVGFRSLLVYYFTADSQQLVSGNSKNSFRHMQRSLKAVSVPPLLRDLGQFSAR